MEALIAAGLARSSVHMSETFNEVIADFLQNHSTSDYRRASAPFRANIPFFLRSCSTSLTSYRLKILKAIAHSNVLESDTVLSEDSLYFLYTVIYVIQM